MKIIELSTFINYSVGSIMRNLQSVINNDGVDKCWIIYFRGVGDKEKLQLKAGNYFSVHLAAFLSRIFDNDGCLSVLQTKKAIKIIKRIKPSILHIHCLHGYSINFTILFRFLRKNPQIKVFWTMHDVWAITGHCCFFNRIKCTRWVDGCFNCPQKMEYPKSCVFDRSRRNYSLKKKAFTSLPKSQLTIITPCNWMSNLMAKTFLKQYQIVTINNGVDLSIFQDYHKTRNRILLGVASVWDKRKGLDLFIKVALNLSLNWTIIIVGSLSRLQKRKIENTRIQFIERTTNVNELVNLYNTSSILFNPTEDDNFPTVNIEAQLCGMKVVTFDIGGSAETDIGNLYILRSKEPSFVSNKIEFIQGLKMNEISKKLLSKEKMAEKYLSMFQAVKMNNN